MTRKKLIIHSVEWANKEQTIILAKSNVEGECDEIKLYASEEGHMDYMKIIFKEAIAGVYGPIGDYVAPEQTDA